MKFKIHCNHTGVSSPCTRMQAAALCAFISLCLSACTPEKTHPSGSATPTPKAKSTPTPKAKGELTAAQKSAVYDALDFDAPKESFKDGKAKWSELQGRDPEQEKARRDACNDVVVRLVNAQLGTNWKIEKIESMGIIPNDKKTEFWKNLTTQMDDGIQAGRPRVRPTKAPRHDSTRTIRYRTRTRTDRVPINRMPINRGPIIRKTHPNGEIRDQAQPSSEGGVAGQIHNMG